MMKSNKIQLKLCLFNLPTLTRLRLTLLWLIEMARAVQAGRNARYGAASLSLARDPVLAALIGERPIFWSRLLFTQPTGLIGWGRRFSGRRVAAVAHRGIKPLLLEDGFLRSVQRRGSPVSLVFDDHGIYYDARSDSRLFRLIPTPLADCEQDRARRIMARWRTLGLSKYNDAPTLDLSLGSEFVLVIDQVRGDFSIRLGGADDASFQDMLNAALCENPELAIVVKSHPDSQADPRKSHFSIQTVQNIPRVHMLRENCHVASLLKACKAVYTVTSQVGFEALMYGKPVRTFGMPFYAGWGLTEDALPRPDQRRPVSLEQLVHAALVHYPRYRDPVTMQPCTVERAIEHVGLQRVRRFDMPQKIVAVGFSRWKRPFLATIFQGATLSFAKRVKPGGPISAGGTLALWGSAAVPLGGEDSPVLRLEDGFLRSSGLGADLVRPLSLVVDDVGIYYDATRPSRLERILDTQSLSEEQRERARHLREKIVALDITKYNLSRIPWTRPNTDAPVVLVVGQVETDASIRLGSPEITTNIDLLRRVRRECPHAYLIYKPHPDVLAGLRRRGNGEGKVGDVADDILTAPVSVGQVLAQVDAVHTMTSLMGFEALLRGVTVVCHGLPFYAGWGLTDDRLACPRRVRRVTLDELVYGALIAYPRYVNHERACFVEPEHVVEQLAAWAHKGPTTRQRKILRALIVAWLHIRGSLR